MYTLLLMTYLWILTGDSAYDVPKYNPLYNWTVLGWGERLGLCKPGDEIHAWQMHFIYRAHSGPPVATMDCLPDRSYISAGIAASNRYRKLITEYKSIYPGLASFYDELAEEAYLLWSGYDDLDTAFNYAEAYRNRQTPYTQALIQSHLKTAEQKLGVDIRVGILPPPIPVWRYRRID